MSEIKKLGSQTAYYGVSSMFGRLLYYLLTPLYTNIFLPPEKLAIVNFLFPLAGLMLVLLTYGMETTFFRFTSKEELAERNVKNTAFTSIFLTTSLFFILGLIFYRQIANLIEYPDMKLSVLYFIIIISADVYATIPFCLLRKENKAKKFAIFRFLGVIINVGLNLFFILLLPFLAKDVFTFIPKMFAEPRVENIFLSNVISSLCVLFMLRKEILSFSLKIDSSLLKKMLRYGLPILIVGTAGIVNEMMDRIFLKYLLPEKYADYWLGVYGSCFKLAVFISLFTQAFRYAAEPFFFSKAKEKNAPQTYADVTFYFTIVISLMYVAIMCNMSWLSHFVGREYRVGINIVPIILFANIFLGLYNNLSIWYKLSDKTIYGAFISIFGAIITIFILFFGIPRYGYIAAAWSHFITYGSMLLLSYFLGQKYYPVPYRIIKISLYLLSAWILSYLSFYVFDSNFYIGNLLFLVYLLGIIFFNRNLLKRVFSRSI